LNYIDSCILDALDLQNCTFAGLSALWMQIHYDIMNIHGN